MTSRGKDGPPRGGPFPATILTADGIALSARIFEPHGPARATVLFTGGVGVPQHVYRHLAGWLAGQGLRGLTFDYRGFGDSAHSPEAIASASLSAWAAEDAVAAFECVERSWPEPVLLLAHSFGGQLLALASPLRRVKSAVLVASQCGSARYWDGTDRLKIAAFWHLLLPLAARLYTTTPKWLGPRVPGGVAREWARWGRAPDWLFSLEPDAQSRLRAFPGPILAYAIEDDDLAPPRAVAALIDRFRPELVTRRHLVPHRYELDRIGHYGLFRPGRMQPVWDEILAFLLSAAAGSRRADDASKEMNRVA